MARPASQRPTDRELEILQVLWNQGDSTVREIYQQLSQKRPTAYNSVLKIIQIMTEKRLVRKDESRRPQVYSANVTRAQVEQSFIRHVLTQVFGGSARRLVMRALSGRKPSEQELEQIRKWLDSKAD